MGKNRPYFVHQDTDPEVHKHVKAVEKGDVVDPDLPKSEATHLLNYTEIDRSERSSSPHSYPMLPHPLTQDSLDEYKDQIRDLYDSQGNPRTD